MQMLHAKSLMGNHCYSFDYLTIMRQYRQIKLKKFHGWYCSANNGSLSQANQPKTQERKYIYNRYPSTVRNESVTLFEIYYLLVFLI